MTVLNILDATGTTRSLVVKLDPVTGAWVPINSSDGTTPTYRYAISGFAPVANPTDFVVMQGSATKTIRIKMIKLSGGDTAQGNLPIQFVRRSTSGTLGSAVLTAITALKHDSLLANDPVPTAIVSTVATANYTTLGTLVAIGGTGRLNLPAAATGTIGPVLMWNFCKNQDKAIILRGVSDFLCLSALGTALLAGTLIDIELEFEEDNS